MDYSRLTEEIVVCVRVRGRLTAALLIVFLATPGILRAQAPPALGESVGSGQTLELQYTATFSQDDLRFAKLRGYDAVRLADGHCLYEPGTPMVPVKTVRIALPAGMAVNSVRLAATQSVELPGEYTILPAQLPRPMSDSARRADSLPPDPEVYASGEPYPGKLVQFAHQADLAGQGVAFLRVFPVQYVPAEKKLTYYTSIDIVLEGVGGYQCADYLPRRISESACAVYEKMISGMVVNPGDVALTTSPGPGPISRGVGPGDYDYVIITDSTWVSDFQPLADWRTRKGIPATIVTTDWIYNDGGYAGADLEKVRAFVEDAHNNWGASHFLLGGDTNVIPYHIRTITIPDHWTDDIPNDTYYADYDEDWICEVHVGRAPVRTTDAISTFINKVFTYEKNPPLTDYATTVAFFGFDIDHSGDQHGETCKENIRGLHLPVSWTLHTEYDSEPGTHKADVVAYLNQGHHLVNHHDHCNRNAMGAGWISHGDSLYDFDINNLANGDRQSILFAVGCFPCDIPAHTSIAEAFVQNPAGGGIAFMGNSRYGWAGPDEDPDYYSIRQDRYFYRALFDEGYERLGECFTDLKNDEFDPIDPYNLHKYCFTQLHLLGAPGLLIWTGDPQSLSVTHRGTIGVGQPTSFPIYVASGGSPVAAATVCLSKGGDVYEVQQTDSAGKAIFEFTAAGTGSLHVTVTGRNYLPYEGQAEVIEAPCWGDLDSDGFRNITDFTLFANAYGSQIGQVEYEPAADFNGDGYVNITDFTQFAGYYGVPCP